MASQPKQVTAVPGHNWIYFSLKHEKPITEKIARNTQAILGYDPRGYGFYSFSVDKKRGEYIARWACSSSCE